MKAWLGSLFLHGIALGALLLLKLPEASTVHGVDVDWLERAKGSRSNAKMGVAVQRERITGLTVAVAAAARAESDQGSPGGECDTCTAIVEYRPAPPYPVEAQEAGLEGEILVEVRTDDSGFVKNVELVKSSGHAVLDRSVVDTVKTWRLKPLRVLRVPINFHLES